MTATTRGVAAVVSAIVVAAIMTPRSHAAAGPIPQQTPMFRAAADVVVVNVSVRDGLKVPQDLTASDFAVLDNGVRQDVSNVTFVPIDVTVALDVSSSENGAPLARLERGVTELVSDLAPDERVRLLAFNHHVRQVMDFTADRGAALTAFRSLSAGGGTSIFDTLASAMIAPADPGRRQLVTLFTDGEDGLSTIEPDELLETGRRSSATVSVVIPRATLSSRRVTGPGGRQMLAPGTVPPPQRPESPVAEDVRLINDLVTLTGGRLLVDPGPPADLGTSFRSALDAFRMSYVLYFTPRGVTRPGFHTLTVTLPQHQKFTVTSRSGYFGG